MGYTHYWWRPPEIDAPVFHAIRTDFERLILPLSDLSVELAGPLGEGLPVITEDEVAFNGRCECGHPKNEDIVIPYPSEHGQGVGPSATAVDGDFYNIGVTLKHRCCVGHCCCETFRLDRRKPRQSWNSPNERGFVCDGTKTAFRPYDIAVTAALLIAKRHLSDHLTIHSNGADAQWRDAKSLCQNVLGYGDWFGIVEEEVEDELPANIATSEGVSRWRTVRQRTLVGSARPVLLE